MFCENCGKEILNNNLCMHCGAPAITQYPKATVNNATHTTNQNKNKTLPIITFCLVGIAIITIIALISNVLILNINNESTDNSVFTDSDNYDVTQAKIVAKNFTNSYYKKDSLSLVNSMPDFELRTYAKKCKCTTYDTAEIASYIEEHKFKYLDENLKLTEVEFAAIINDHSRIKTDFFDDFEITSAEFDKIEKMYIMLTTLEESGTNDTEIKTIYCIKYNGSWYALLRNY